MILGIYRTMSVPQPNYRQLLPLTVLWAFMILLCNSANAASPKKPGWIIRQNSQTYGIVKTLVSADGIRLEMGNIKVVIVQPSYRVTFFNERTKNSFDESFEEFQKRVPPRNCPPGWLKKVEPAKPFYETVGGVKGKHYVWYTYNPKNPAQRHVYYDYVVTKDLGLPERLMDVASICCYVPAGNGLPLRVTGDKRVVYLNTTFMTKTMVDPAVFKIPKGYNKVKSEMEVLLKEAGTVQDDDVSDLFKAIPKH